MAAPPADRLPPPATAAPAPVKDEAERRERLDAMKRKATWLLVAAAIVYVVARLVESRHPWVGFIRATAEASMVGGLADWFAVTALFRHPMGIPIPHTAIVPERKDRVGRTLGAFVQRNFLTREVVGGRLRNLHIGERLARWLAEPENARTIARHTATSLAAAAQVLSDDEIQGMIDRAVANRIRATKVAPLAGKFLSLVTAGGRHQELLDEAIKVLARGVEENRDIIRERVERESPWWVPTAIDDKIYRKIIAAIENTLVDIRDNPNHPLRARFDLALSDFVERLQYSPEMAVRVEGLKQELLETEAVRTFSSSLWIDAKAALMRHAEQPDTMNTATMERGINAFANAVLADPALLDKVDEFIVDVAVFLVARYQDDVADLIAHTVAGWDPQVTSERVELAIGRDLQFIRINGTIVGGLAGLLIYTLSRLVP